MVNETNAMSALCSVVLITRVINESRVMNTNRAELLTHANILRIVSGFCRKEMGSNSAPALPAPKDPTPSIFLASAMIPG